MGVSCHRPVLPGTSLKPAVIPTAQASHCSTFLIMCDVPSIAVFCTESIECFPGTASKFFLKLVVTIPVAPIITGIIVHFRFHIRCISIHKLLYFIFFSTFLLHNISVCGYCHIFLCACFLFFVFNYYIWPICCNFSVCVYCLIFIIPFMQGIYTYIPETNYVPREYSVAAILLLLFMVLISLVPVLNLLYFYISTFRSIYYYYYYYCVH